MFINIHSHKKPQLTNELVIRNGYLHHFSHHLPQYHISVGLHPWFCGKKNDNWQQQLRYLANNDKAIAIGECGLDCYKGPDLKAQLDVFKQHISLANELNMPLIVHLVKCRDLFSACLPDIHVPVILHGFNGSAAYAQSLLLNQHVYFSLGSVLYKSPGKAASLLQTIPLHRLFLETDNSNYTIHKTYLLAAGLKGITVELLQQVIKQNFCKVFGVSLSFKGKS